MNLKEMMIAPFLSDESHDDFEYDKFSEITTDEDELYIETNDILHDIFEERLKSKRNKK